MSLKHALLVPGAALIWMAAAADSSAQSYDRQRLERQRLQQSYGRPAPQARPVPQARLLPQARSVPQSRPSAVTVVAPPSRLNATGARPIPVTPTRLPEPAKASPPPPLTEAELAAKAEIDELLSREPALAAAKERPDPRVARAAAAKHDAELQRLAALKTRDEADAAKRRDIAEKAKGRDAAKAAAQKSKPDTSGKSVNVRTAAKAETAKPAAAVASPSAPAPAALPAAAPQPVLRMPTP